MLTCMQQHREEVYREQGNGPKIKFIWQTSAVSEESLSKEAMLGRIG